MVAPVLIQRAMPVAQWGLLLGVGLATYRLIVPPSLNVAMEEMKSPVTSQPAEPIEEHPLSWYAPMWQRDLRRPPIDPVVKKKPAKQRKPEPLRLALLGTVVEADDRYAVFRTAEGRIVVKGIRDEIDRFTVEQIDRGRAELVNGSRRVNVTVPGYEALKLE